MKNNRSYLTHIISILLLGTTSFVQANGAYIGGTVGKTDLFNEFIEGGSTAKFFAGYNVGKNLAIEASVGATLVAEGEEIAPSLIEELSVTTVSVAALAKYPVLPQLEIFTKLGMANTTLNASNIILDKREGEYLLLDSEISGTAKLFGIGANINYTPNMAIRAEYETTYLGDQEYSTSSIGLMYKTF